MSVCRTVITDLHQHVPRLLNPIEPQLFQPRKRQRALRLVVHQLLVTVPCMDIKRDDGNDLAAVQFVQFSEDELDELLDSGGLDLDVLLDGLFVAAFEVIYESTGVSMTLSMTLSITSELLV